jgi:translocation and assembly module TamA
MLKHPGNTARRGARIVRWLVPAVLPCAAFAAELGIKVEGVPDEIRDAVLADLTLQQYATRDSSPAQIRRLFKSAEPEVRKGLEPFGYYNATVQSELHETGKGFEAVFNVTPGPPVLVQNESVKVEGGGAEMRQVRRAIRRFSPGEGERLEHGLYEASKGAIESALFETGFLRAKAVKHRVEVSRQANTANIDLSWESGPRMKFGRVRFSEAQFPPEFLRRFVPWDEGTYYSPDELLEFQQRLADADYFANIAVVPDTDEPGTEVPVDVSLTPAKRSVYSAGVFMSTDTGPGVRLGLKRRWMNEKGHKFNSELQFAQRLTSVSTDYRIPLKGRNERSYNFGANYRDETTDTSTSRLERLSANETRQWRGFTRTLGLTYVSGNFEIAENQEYSSLFYFEGTLTKKDANDLSFPRRGYSLGLTLRYAPEVLLSDTTFTATIADAKWIHSLGRRNRLLLRGTLGAMAVDDFNMLPPDLRFFAGGDRSIRGFDYQQLGTTNDAGLVIGGEYLAVASAEVERYFLPRWGAAVFVDAGDAFRAGEFDKNIGAGIGLRWRSPVGVLRVDFAKPVASDLADQWRLHFSVGPDL